MMPTFIVLPNADVTAGVPTTLANALIDTDTTLGGLTNDTAYRAFVLSAQSDSFTPTGVAPPSYPITFPTALERDIADAGVDTYTVAAGFTADAGDLVVISAYAMRASGTGIAIETMIINGESMTRREFSGSGVGAIAVFSHVLTDALEATDNIVANFTSGSLCNVWHLQPVRAEGGGTLGTAVRDVTTSTAGLTLTLDVPANGTVVGVFASNETNSSSVVTGLDTQTARGFVNVTRRMVTVAQTEMTAQTGRSVTFVNPDATAISRRGILIAITPEE